MKRCLICLCELNDHQNLKQWVFMEDMLCAQCRSRLPYFQQHIHIQGLSIYAFFRYDPFMERLLFQFKEGRDVALAPLFFDTFERELRKRMHQTWVLMPSSHEKCMERGFFPLREMLKQMEVPLYEPLYKQTTFKQSARSKQERWNVQQEVHLKQEYPLPKGDLLLIDDVCTTSATLQCAYQLLSAHSNTIEALVLCIHPLLLEQDKNASNHLKRRGRFWKEQ